MRYGFDVITESLPNQEEEVQQARCSCLFKQEVVLSYTPHQVESIDQALFERLQTEKSARLNWRKLYTLIQIVKALSPRESKEMRDRAKLDHEEEEVQVSCWKLEWLDRYVMTPENLYVTLWTFIALSVNTVAIFYISYDCAFHLAAIESYNPFILVIEILLLFELIMVFFIAIYEKDNPRGFICSLFGFCGFCKKRCLL